jgi:Protein of unknown function (DUF559)
MASCLVNRHAVRARHRRLFPGVYVDRAAEPGLLTRTRAAWLWSRRTAVVGGLAAAALHGAKWIDADETIELISPNTRPPSGIRCRNDAIPADEIVIVGGMPVTTAARTAFDLGRHTVPIDRAVARVDALLNATGLSAADVARLTHRHPGSRGLRRLDTVLALVDPGSESPRETSLRLSLVRAGLPAPQTQIEVRDEAGAFVARLDMGWREVKVAVEYDGEQHRTNRAQYVRDVRRLERLDRLGWIVIRVLKEDRPDDVVQRVRQAFARRG